MIIPQMLIPVYYNCVLLGEFWPSCLSVMIKLYSSVSVLRSGNMATLLQLCPTRSKKHEQSNNQTGSKQANRLVRLFKPFYLKVKLKVSAPEMLVMTPKKHRSKLDQEVSLLAVMDVYSTFIFSSSDNTACPDVSNELDEYNLIITDRNDGQNNKNAIIL